jgi:hypothetical protein
MEPMGSFAEWKCGACGALRNVPTREAEAVKTRRRRAVEWPVGWAHRAIGNFGMVVCDRCIPRDEQVSP